jgi:formylglycine-generating enzyme required for sulfatase activity
MLNQQGDNRVSFSLDDRSWNIETKLWWDAQREQTLCTSLRWHGGGFLFGPRECKVRERLHLKVVVADGRRTVLLNDQRVNTDWNDARPAYQHLAISTGRDAAARIYRCSFRELTEADVRPLGWLMPQAKLALNSQEAAARLNARKADFKKSPSPGHPFVLPPTGMPLAWIPPGEFRMGSGASVQGHRVKLTKGFWMGQYLVTQGEWQALMGANPSHVQGSRYLPVDYVSWDDATRFCRKLTELERSAKRLPRDYEYRLPTEAEWEYACRAGANGDYAVDPGDIWHAGNSGGRVHEVGERSPNAFSLYDMQGNVWEWCYDAWHDFPKGNRPPEVDPVHFAQSPNDARVLRGGGWWLGANDSRCSVRDWDRGAGGGYRGFRIVLAPVLHKK